ncbi:MAG TPA: EamA family transporter RarD [Magnetospirillaceae bacterium]|nr:EamA family transporter RarD [Magnetospirillaceae bacterium]
MGTSKRGSLSSETQGLVFGLSAFFMWGFFPVYWKSLDAVPAFQILAHRILWAFVFTLALVLALRRGDRLAELLRSRRRFAAAAAAGVLVAVNWGIYIWAVNADQIVESSLGYFLNPLVSAALGALILREHLDRGMVAAYAIAGLGIVVQAVSYGRLPWISLSLAATFSLYSLVKKIAGLDVLTGLVLEAATTTPVALAFLLAENGAGRGAFWNAGAMPTALLVLAGPVTAIPLLAFAAGVVRLPLTRIGILQYLSPTLQLLLGVFAYGERLGSTRAFTLGCILAALVVFGLTRRGAGRPRVPAS